MESGWKVLVEDVPWRTIAKGISLLEEASRTHWEGTGK
jgi:hypothetical protein